MDKTTFEYKEKIMSLIKSGQKENINLTFEISKGLNLPIESWVHDVYEKQIIEICPLLNIQNESLEVKLINIFNLDVEKLLCAIINEQINKEILTNFNIFIQ